MVWLQSSGQINDSVESEEVTTRIGKPPVFSGDLKDFINNHLVYPQSALNDSIEGTVLVSLLIDTLGKTIGHKVIRGIRSDLNEEALRVTKLIIFSQPAMQGKKPIWVRLVVPVEFKLPKQDEKKGNVFIED